MIRRLLIANRGEIAIRLARGAGDLGIGTVAVFAKDDRAQPHVAAADEAWPLAAAGPAAYLDIAALVRVAREAGCDAVHPGYGFLSESAAFARACAAADLVFVGPSPETLEQLGDKARARALAERQGVPTLPGIPAGASPEDMAAFLATVPAGSAIMIKAVHGGGGIGMRRVGAIEDVAAAHAAAAREAKAAFGDDALYAEAGARRRPPCRGGHPPATGLACWRSAIATSPCNADGRRSSRSLQHRTSPNPVRARLWDAAATLAAAARYRNLGTIEFLLADDGERFFFIEANPRLQVEHTVTEEAVGLDLVQLQLRLAGGESLGGLGLMRAPSLSRRRCPGAGDSRELDRTAGVVRSAATSPSVNRCPGLGVRVDGAGTAGLDVPLAYDLRSPR